MTVGAIVAAAGRGERLGAAVPKALLPVGGVPLVVHAVRALSAGGARHVVVAAPMSDVDAVRALVHDAVVVAGGATRQDSVRHALAALPPSVDVVLVHDAARGLAPASLVADVVAAVHAGAGAVVPVVPVADTVKEVDGRGVVIRTVDRGRLRAVQTPQGFRRDVLVRAHAHGSGQATATDDASLVEASGVDVVTITGSPEAFKVTTALDVTVAEAVLAARSAHVL